MRRRRSCPCDLCQQNGFYRNKCESAAGWLDHLNTEIAFLRRMRDLHMRHYRDELREWKKHCAAERKTFSALHQIVPVMSDPADVSGKPAEDRILANIEKNDAASLARGSS